MYKKTIIVFVLFLMFTTDVSYASSVTIPYYGTTSESSQFLWADASYGDDDFTQISYVSNSNNAEIRYYSNSEGSASLIGSDTLSNGEGTVVPPGGTNAIKLYSADGGEVYLTYAASTNPANTDIYFESSDNSGGSDSGNCGCIFNTPGWQEYIGKVDDIISAIPPPPNWGAVADTFRDSIVPNLVSEVEDMLGYAPPVIQEPSYPPPLDDGGLESPKGQEAEGLGDASFDSNDIKDGAEPIEEKEDESGGFNILNPMENIPSEEDFQENVPEEKEVIAPEVPEEEAETPGAPEVPEESAPIPGEPQEEAPTPEEPEGNFPVPGESDNQAPIPGGTEESAPIPGDSGSSYPIPGGNDNSYPIPGVDETEAPIPGQEGSTFPIP